MATPSIEFLPVANGDMTLISTKNNKKILIDCNFREPSVDVVDVKEMLRSRLETNEDGQLYLDVFVVTHPDQDHTRGFKELFHTGESSTWSEKKNKIIINEIWSSPRVFRRASRKVQKADKNNTLCEDAKAINKEAKRRANLYKETKKIGQLGDRIVILTHDEDGKTEGYEGIIAALDSSFIADKSGIDDNSLTARLLGPADRVEVTDEDVLQKNDSSAIINFGLTEESGNIVNFLNGGDAGVGCWRYLNKRMEQDSNTDYLKYDILQAPHHCSWRSLSEDSESDCEEKGIEPKVDQDAYDSLSHANEEALIISSSNTFGDNTPPSKKARKKYKEVLKDKNGIFYCVADSKKGGKQTSLMVELKDGKASKRKTPVNFSNTPNPAAVQKKAQPAYA
ncbi:ComEC/Rec2 family competence protein [Aeromonas salmonicida]|uniref:cobalamin biosynthesis protein CobQ n=1 Tax=Aeromonas salmonicida TaxID=645 RepID=UPI001788CF46|nr:cobalamin biosynthesis protein CobQ [Aeromonas salmonicida]QOI95899.1 cobalamin biosynthesis protein CobQ [Aeromonas salmonicida subsp. masoucida]